MSKDKTSLGMIADIYKSRVESALEDLTEAINLVHTMDSMINPRLGSICNVELGIASKWLIEAEIHLKSIERRTQGLIKSVNYEHGEI